MGYQFIQIIGLEKPRDLRRARRALAAHSASPACWVDPLDQVAWLQRPGGPFTDDETGEAVDLLNRSGFWAVPVDQRKISGPACIALHRRRRIRDIRQRLAIAVGFGLPVIALHLFGHRLAADPARELWPLWMQLLLTGWVLFAAAGSWFYHGIWSVMHGHWRWRTGAAAVLAGGLLLGTIDLVLRAFGVHGLMHPLLGPNPADPLRSLFAPTVVALILLLVRGLLMRLRLRRISDPFDRWLANLTGEDETRLRFFLQVQSSHQQHGLDLSWGKLADRYSDYGLAAAAVVFVLALILTGSLMPAWLIAAALLLTLDPRTFQLTWVAPEVLAERRAAAQGLFIANPRVFGKAGHIGAVVFEKTGTVTSGRSEVIAVEVNALAGLDLTGDELLRLAASAEQGSEHSMARGLLHEAQQRKLTLSEAAGIRRQAGLGVSATVDGRAVHVGSERLMAENGLDTSSFAQTANRLRREGYSVVLVGVGEQIAGAIAVEEAVRPGAEQTVGELQGDGYGVRLITGDSESAGAAIAARLGIDQVVVELGPQGKIDQLARWRQAGDCLAVVGTVDKDEAALGAADVAIAFYDFTSAEDRLANLADVADRGLGDIEDITGADVVVLGHRIERIPLMLRIARHVGSQRTRSMAFVTGVVVVSAAISLLMPLARPIAEWSPAVVAALTMAELPLLLSRPDAGAKAD
ncbi:MAG: Potassium-transporting ATPase ATP-binding subunit [Phycisphaerae bacterium]|nr:Potassium-transporting ATPase ATP-binding subunit [Phycisphaerae bacterium]